MASALKSALEELLFARRLRTEGPPLRGELVVSPLPTGIGSLDGFLGGGFPRGQVSEVCGPPSTGRMGLTLSLFAHSTRRGGLAAWVDPDDHFVPASAEEAVRGSDIVSAATNTVDPVVQGRWLEPGMHVTSLVGGDGFLPRKELDDEAIKKAGLIVVGYKAQIFIDKQAEFHDRLERGIVKAEDLHELGDLVNGKCRGRADEQEITLFKNNTGMGIQFAATARKMYEKAREKSIGTELPLDLFMTRRGDKAYSP